MTCKNWTNCKWKRRNPVIPYNLYGITRGDTMQKLDFSEISDFIGRDNDGLFFLYCLRKVTIGSLFTDDFEKFRGIFHREIQVKSSLNHKSRSVFSIFKICLIVPSIADSTNFVGLIYI